MKKLSYLKLILFLLVISSGSRVIFAEQDKEQGLKFGHGLHIVENEMGCTDCHLNVPSDVDDKMSIPNHDVCSDCHDVDDVDECVTCHVDPNDPMIGKNRVTLTSFYHKRHIESDLQCEKCHGVVGNAEYTPLFPNNLECVMCHSANFVTPEDHHNLNWNEAHGLEAAFSSNDCSICHEQSSCDECHQGENIHGVPHPPTWKFNHFAETSLGGECMVCHETRETCTSCHKALKLLPHELGPTWANSSDGGNHPEEAKTDMESCISCHDIGEADPTCARCHEE
jgi:hypothetical protein